MNTSLKKSLSILLSLIVLLTSFGLSSVAFAAEEETDIPVSSIKRTSDTNYIFLEVGKTKKAKVEIFPNDATNKAVKWKSSNEEIATVSSKGTITAVSTGKAIITAKTVDMNKKCSFRVFVIKRNTGKKLSTSKMNIVSTKSSLYSYEKMKTNLKELSDAYPEIMTYSSIGKTYDKRNIYEVVLGNPSAKNHILIQATMHAREYINSLLTMRQIESICANYYSGSYNGKTYCEMFENVCFHIIPMTNPDGVTISQFGPDAIIDPTLRKNVKTIFKKYGKGNTFYYMRWKANGRGVDLNRNYPLNWKISHPTPEDPRNEGYKGPKAGSEKETKILMKRVDEIKPKAIISYHSTGSIIYWDFGQTGQLQKDCETLFNIANNLTGYKSFESYSTQELPLSPCFGDWVCAVKKIPTLTIETGRNIAPIEISEFGNIWKENKHMLPAIAFWALKPSGTSIDEIIAKDDGFRVIWKEKKNCYYQIKYSTNKNFSNSTFVKVANKTRISRTISNLKNNKTYYVKVRTYKKIRGVEYYSNWCSPKSIKTK